MVPYEGREPYIFISYAHKDSDVVMPIIEAMADYGFRIWYDEGIEAGTEWPEYIAEHLENAGAVIAFLSDASLGSINCRQEINEAINMQKDLLAIHLREVKLTPGMRMRLSLIQAMFMYRHKDMDSFYGALFKAQILAPCLGEKKVVEQPVTPKTETVPMVESIVEQQVQEPENTFEEYPISNPEDFKIHDGVLVEYTGSSVIVLVPEGVREIGYNEQNFCLALMVNSKAKNAFGSNKDITEVIVPEGVEYIGHMAFYGCENLVRVVLPKTLKKIDKNAFQNCYELKQLEIPEDSNLQFIGESAFENCSSLDKLSLPRSLNYIGKNAFRACRSLQSVRFPLDGALEKVGEDTFFNCSGLEEVTLPKCVTVIEKRAFYGCESLWDINMPQSLREIKEAAFKNCERLELVDCAWLGTLKIIEKEAFRGCTALKTLRLSDTVEMIEEEAFVGCISLDRVDIPRKTKMPMFKQVFPKHTTVKRV